MHETIGAYLLLTFIDSGSFLLWYLEMTGEEGRDETWFRQVIFTRCKLRYIIMPVLVLFPFKIFVYFMRLFLISAKDFIKYIAHKIRGHKVRGEPPFLPESIKEDIRYRKELKMNKKLQSGSLSFPNNEGGELSYRRN